MSDVGRDGARLQTAFLAHLRHELRTPINAIIGYGEMLREDTKHEGFAGDLDRILAAGRELSRLVGELLGAPGSDIEAHDGLTAVASTVRHALRTPINSVLGYCEIWLEEAADAGLEAARNDLARIHAAARRLVAMIDDIVGLAASAAEGKLDLEAQAAPAMVRDAIASIRPLEAEAAEAPAAGAFLLVVDDNEVNRDILARRLSRQGYAVTTAEHGRAALARLAERPYDLVLLDVMMPEMNGYQVLQRMKADRSLRHIPVIVISALDEVDSVVRCIELGAEDYLPKPFNPVLLRARLEACLEKKLLRDREVTYLKRIEVEKKRADDLLHVILPGPIVEELKATNRVAPRHYDDVAVLFCDVVGFTPYCSGRRPEEIVQHLQGLVEAYETLALGHGLQKIKTIGDCFMATAGLLTPLPNPTLACVRAGLEMVETSQRLPPGWSVRVGIHVGPVTAGVVGHRQYLFDIFGDTVNTAARVESHGAPGAVNVSDQAWARVAAHCRGSSLGRVEVKGKGPLEFFRVDGLSG